MTDIQKTPFVLTAVLILCGIFAAGQFAKISVPIALLIERFPERGASIGFLVSTLSIVGLVAGLFSGALLARIGFRKPMIFALLLGGALSLLQILPLNFPAFLLTRICEGVSHLIIVVAAPTLLGQICAREHKAIALTLWSTVFGCAFSLFTWAGLPVIGLFLDPNAGLSALFSLHGVVMIALAMAVWRLLPAGIVPRSDVPLTLRRIWARHRQTYASPWICAPALGWFFYAAGFVALVTAMPLYFETGLASLAQGLLPLASLIVSLTLGLVLVRRFSPTNVTIAGFIAAAVLSACLILDGRAGMVEVVSIAVLGVLGLVQAGTFSSIPILIPDGEDQALANGALAQLGNAGNVIGTPLLLFLMKSFGLAGAVGFCVVLFCLGALVHVLLAVLRQRAA